MFTLLFERDVGLCRSAGLVARGRVVLSTSNQGVCSSSVLRVVDAGFGVLWEKDTGQLECGIIPTARHDRILVTHSSQVDKHDEIPNFMWILDLDEYGNQVGRRPSPFMGVSLARLPTDHGYVAFGKCLVRGVRSHWETRAAILPSNVPEVKWLPGISAAWLTCGELALSTGDAVAIGNLAADGFFTRTLEWPYSAPGAHWLFEIEGNLWVASETAMACVGRIEGSGTPVQQKYDLPDRKCSRFVCYAPYIVAAGSFKAPLVLNTRTGTSQTLSLEDDVKTKDVFALDIAPDDDGLKILTLHRSIHSPSAILRIWGEALQASAAGG